MEIQVFGKQNCAKCESTKHKIQHFIAKLGMDGRVQMVFFDMDTVDGMAEGAFHDVYQIPTTIVQNGDGRLVRWDGIIPASADLKQYLGTA
jgi:hypothetical protein